ncbi:MAG: peptidoglycan editing factor PgeF [Bacillota bacterium]|nr:peptidoglycan editing factor PgeF [Bacillota bacterium]
MNIGFIHHNIEGFCYLTAPSLDECGVRHCFTTRLGGVSKAHLSELNLGFGRGDDEFALKENYRRVFDCLGFTGENLSTTMQIHKTNVAYVEKPILRSENCDALITDKPKIPLMSYCADCVPILIYDRRKNCAATCHSGWRGTASKIALVTVQRMKSLFGSDPEDLLCAIGPSIGKCCFEVMDDVVDIFKESFNEFSQELIKEDDDGIHYRINLQKAVALALYEAGIPDENLSMADECTLCHNDLYFSSRGGKKLFGAMGAFIELKG